jgi:hypothetical protein
MYTTGYLKRRVILKQQFTIEKGFKKEVLPQMLRPIPQKVRIRHAILLH